MGDNGGIRVAAAAVLTAALGLGGCGFASEEFRDERGEPAAVTAVSIEGGSGTVRIAAGEGPTHVKRRVRYRGDRPGETYRMDGSTLALRTGCGRSCSVDYEVTVPRGVKVGGRNGSGAIDVRDVASVSVSVGSGDVTVRGVAGEVTATTGSGRIELSDIAGNANCRTGSGAIRLAGVSGSVTADTGSGEITGRDLRGTQTRAHSSSGSINLDLGAPQGVDADTSSGDVRVTVPGETNYRVDARAPSGRADIRMPSYPAAQHRLNLHSGSGDITVATS